MSLYVFEGFIHSIDIFGLLADSEFLAWISPYGRWLDIGIVEQLSIMLQPMMKSMNRK
jgi:hypothetical protein